MHSALIGDSAAMDRLRHTIGSIAGTTLPVLVVGETGTGKEVVARAIHNAKARPGPFVVVDCSALVDTLMEAELFGHKRGAFTGAVSDRAGLLAAAAGGTAFFDEIGELSPPLQAKLLRLLQDHQYRPVGATQYARTDCRVIAATNRDLRCAVGEGAFREDLYYRLSAITLRVPPLRKRKADIPKLIDHFLAQFAGTSRPTTTVVQRLIAYDWPGNVRQLEHCIRCMAEINACPLLGTGDLECPIAGTCTDAATRDPGQPNPTRLADLERDAIIAALHRANGNRATAAAALGIGRTMLYRRAKQYHLNAVPWRGSLLASPANTV